MNSTMEIIHMVTDFVSQKASLLSLLPVLIAMPIRSQLKKVGSLTDEPILFKKPLQQLETIPVHLNPKNTKRGRHKWASFYSFVGLLGCILLSGCTGSTYSSHFDCPMGEGAGCASLSRVNKMIDRREIDLGNDDIPSSKGPLGNQVLSNQVYVYFGPDQLSRLISTDEPKIQTAEKGN